MTNPNKALSDWLLHKVFQVSEGELLTIEKMNELGFDSVIICKDENGNYTEGNKYWYTTVPTFHVDFGDGLQAEEVVDSKNKKRTLVTVDTKKVIEKKAF